ncbi:MAG: hypothetical protein PF487_14390 [Bacteroidales bacterium]|jgi:hypothetical protein|nr:hypothetical protein [Bacteroidales bacterium]
MKFRIIRTAIIVSVCLFTSSCFHMTRLNDFEWAFRDITREAENNGWTDSKYYILTKSDSIFVQAFANKDCKVLNADGLVIDTLPYDTTMNKRNWIDIGNESRINVWREKVILKDSSEISSVEYISKRNGPLRFRGPRPDRERFIKFIVEGESYLIRLPLIDGQDNVNDICQLNSSQFVISFVYEYEPHRNAHGSAIGLIDLMKFKKRLYRED